MVHRSRLSPLPRTLLVIMLALMFMSGASARAQEPPTRWQALGGPGGPLTHLVAGPAKGEFYAVTVSGVNRQADQTEWRDTGLPSWSDALYLSRDEGATWQPATNDLPPGEITALYVDHAGRVWTGIRNRSEPTEARSGLWRSEDHGATWREMPLERKDLVIETITEDARQQLLVASVAVAGAEQGIIYRTTNDGAGWTSQDVSFPQSSPGKLTGLLAHPARPGLIFVLASNGDLLRSSDDGSSWQSTAGAPGATAGSAQLAFFPDVPDSGILVQSQGTTTTVRRTSDAGATWSEVRATGLPGGAPAVRSLVALPKGVLLLNTDSGTYRSADTGRSWQPLEGALSSGFVRAWATHGRDTQPVLAATDYGLFASTDGGAVWRGYGTGLPANGAVQALLTHKDRSGMIAASLRPLGDADPPELLLTRDNGRTWLPADGGGAWSEATAWAIDSGNPDGLYVAGRTFVASTKDGGLSWKTSPRPDSARSAVVVAPSESSRVYVDGAPFVRSLDGGQTWAELPARDRGGPDVITGLAVDPADAAHLWGGAANGAYESRDGGTTWKRSGLDGQKVRWLATGGGKGGEPLTVYAGLADGGMMRLRAATADWQLADSGLPARSVITAFASDPRTPGLLWAARDGGGVYRSTNGGDSWTNAGAGLGENLALTLAVNYQAPGGVLLGSANAGVLALGSNGPAPRLTETPTGSPTSTPAGQGGRAGVDARIEVVWPHDFAPIDQAELANIGIRLFVPRSLQSPACGWQPKVQLWRAVDNEPAEFVKAATQGSVDGKPFPYWEANDVDIAAGRDPNQKIYFLVTVEGVETATSVWAHAADARTYFPEQQVPSGIATGTVDAVDARIQIVWPHDAAGAEASVDQAPLANVVVTLFKHGTRLSVPQDWQGGVRLYGAWNSEVARRLAPQPTVQERQAGVITYPVWTFDDVPVDRAKEKTNKLYLWAVADGAKSYPTVWAHGADARTFFPTKDEPIQGCLP